MKHENSMSVEEYRKRYVHGTRKTRSTPQNHAEAKILRQTVEQIRSLQTYNPAILFNCPYRLDLEVFGFTPADEDNIRKGINDAIQGVVVRDDRDSIGGSITLHQNYNQQSGEGLHCTKTNTKKAV